MDGFTNPRIVRRVPRVSELAPLLKFKPIARNAVERRLRDVHTIEDLRRVAERRTPTGPFEYVDGPADAEISIGRARAAYRDLKFRPHVLRDVFEVDRGVELLGEKYNAPFGLAPTGFTRMMHVAGEKAVARAAAHFNIPYGLSSFGTTPPILRFVTQHRMAQTGSSYTYRVIVPGPLNWYKTPLTLDAKPLY